MPQQVTSSPFYAAQPIPNGGGGAPGGFGLGAGSGSGSGSQDPSHVAPGYAGGGGGFGGGLGGGLGANHNINANAPPMGTSFPRHGSFHGSSPMAGPSRWAGSGDPAGVMSGLSILKSRRDRLVTSAIVGFCESARVRVSRVEPEVVCKFPKCLGCIISHSHVPTRRSSHALTSVPRPHRTLPTSLPTVLLLLPAMSPLAVLCISAFPPVDHTTTPAAFAFASSSASAFLVTDLIMSFSVPQPKFAPRTAFVPVQQPARRLPPKLLRPLICALGARSGRILVHRLIGVRNVHIAPGWPVGQSRRMGRSVRLVRR
jgi:hypothetical protein